MVTGGSGIGVWGLEEDEGLLVVVKVRRKEGREGRESIVC